ncbi:MULTISPECIES: TetR/AcrR family transcriptional regulator [unclassified Corynebacterium]|uniref:TetR/AcrR family transcriptional regulator n=1 Tax=unclassified Corynebacterium TaxID=2624378 RepID=UPI0034CF1576
MPATTPASPGRPRGRRPVLSLELIVDATVELLDQVGESKLTFRRLAEHVGTGVGSLYHYVASKQELLDHATNRVLGDVISGLSLPADPYAALHALSLALYESMQLHRWTGSYLLRDTGTQPNSMRIFDLFGQQTLRLELSNRARFNAVNALVSYVIGAGAEMREAPDYLRKQGYSDQQLRERVAQSWRDLDSERYPFAHLVAEEFATHDDTEQFSAGVWLFLDGLKARTSANDSATGTGTSTSADTSSDASPTASPDTA